MSGLGFGIQGLGFTSGVFQIIGFRGPKSRALLQCRSHGKLQVRIIRTVGEPLVEIPSV